VTVHWNRGEGDKLPSDAKGTDRLDGWAIRTRGGRDQPCPHCQIRVARLYPGLDGYSAAAALAIRLTRRSGWARKAGGHFQACKLRLRLDGQAQRLFQSAQRGCIGARTIGSSEKV
jgi:hypothetical protein